MKSRAGIAALAFWSISVGALAANSKYCGELTNAFGPFDYVDATDRANLPIVERHHFAPEVENLVRGMTGPIAGDLHYTLAVFPNHHRALASMGNLSLRDKQPQPNGAKFSAECYFERAIRFKPEDGIVRMVYGNYLAKKGENGKAIEQLDLAARLEPDNANIHYSLGLLYLKKKDYDRANAAAKKAYSLGYPLPWLKEKLVEARKWSD